MYISYMETTDERHRSHWIIHNGPYQGFASFDTKEQLDRFARTLGFSYTLRSECTISGSIYREYAMSKQIEELSRYFWSMAEVPDDAKPILALSNGSIVTCYYLTTDDLIEFYRPNPNASEVYDPLPIELHIAHSRIYGKY